MKILGLSFFNGPVGHPRVDGDAGAGFSFPEQHVVSDDANDEADAA